MSYTIRSLSFARYRGFRDPQQHSLSRLNLLYGENNSGKTALTRLPAILARSRMPSRPGLDWEAPLFNGGAFREIQWRGPLASELDRDLVLGLQLDDGARWSWTFRWQDMKGIAVVQRLEVAQGTRQIAFELEDLGGGSYPRDATYRAASTPLRLGFDGLVPRPGVDPLIDHCRDNLISALESVRWLQAMRKGPGRAGTARGGYGAIDGDGEATSAMLLADASLRRAVSDWFFNHARCTVEVESLGPDRERLVLQPTDLSAYAVPFPDAGEGLQHVFPLVVAIEHLRREGGLLCVEEPESHLHPRLQRALAQLLADALAVQPKATVVLETHSELLLLAALQAAVGPLAGAVRVDWVEVGRDGAGVIVNVPLDDMGRPTSPVLEQAFDTMGTMRRELIQLRRNGQEPSNGG